MSREVKRYDCTDGGARFCQGCYTMSECEFGEYVSWDDYESLLAERDAAKTAAERYQLLASTLLADCTGTAMNTQEGALYRALNEIEHVNSTAEIDAIFDAALQGAQP